MPYKVLWVCTGNQCRSPAAQGILEQLLQKEQIQSIRVDSAGIYGATGYPPVEEAIAMAKQAGMDISGLRSKPVSRELIEEADLILVMGRMHRAVILNSVSSSRDKVFLLKSYGRDEADPEYESEIEDPMGGEPEGYVRCFEELNREVRRILPILLEKAGGKQSDDK